MKRLVLAGLLVLGLALFSACSPKVQNTGTTEADQDSKPMAGWQKVVTEAKKPAQDDDLQELNHWKNGVRSGQDITSGDRTQTEEKSGSGQKKSEFLNPQDYTAVNAGSLSVEDLNYVLTELVQLGYLPKKTAGEQELVQAIQQLQKDNNLTVTGKLDQATLKLLGV